MAVAIGDIIRIGMQWLIPGIGEFVNVHHMRVEDLIGTPGDETVVEDIKDELLADVYSTVAAITSNGFSPGVCTGYNVTQGLTMPPVACQEYGTESTQQISPAQTCPLVVLRTNEPRRAGRTYLPAITEAGVDNYGNLTVAAASAVANFGLQMLIPHTGIAGEYQRVVCHADGTQPLVPSVAYVPSALRTQRRRTSGRGS